MDHSVILFFASSILEKTPEFLPCELFAAVVSFGATILFVTMFLIYVRKFTSLGSSGCFSRVSQMVMVPAFSSPAVSSCFYAPWTCDLNFTCGVITFHSFATFHLCPLIPPFGGLVSHLCKMPCEVVIVNQGGDTSAGSAVCAINKIISTSNTNHQQILKEVT